jgi:hypothetical protein
VAILRRHLLGRVFAGGVGSRVPEREQPAGGPLELLERDDWGMSVGTSRLWSAEAWRAITVVHEVSLTLSPALEQARVIGVGEAALARWELLTGETLTKAAA